MWSAACLAAHACPRADVSQSIELCAASQQAREVWLSKILGDRYVPVERQAELTTPFLLYLGRIDKAGWLWRKRKYSSRWRREWFVLVGQELHCYRDVSAPPDSMRTIYLSTNSGKPFAVTPSTKRQYAFSIANPNRTWYLAAES